MEVLSPEKERREYVPSGHPIVGNRPVSASNSSSRPLSAANKQTLQSSRPDSAVSIRTAEAPALGDPGTKLKTRMIVTMQRLLDASISTVPPSVTPVTVASMSDEDCLGVLLHERGRRLGKYGDGGKGKCVWRYFRLVLDGAWAQLVWARSADDIKQLNNVIARAVPFSICVHSELFVFTPLSYS